MVNLTELEKDDEEEYDSEYEDIESSEDSSIKEDSEEKEVLPEDNDKEDSEEKKVIDKDTIKRAKKRLLLNPMQIKFYPEIIYIVGESGSGKTTFLKYLIKSLSDQSVKVQIYGVDLKNVNYRSLGKMMCFMSQSYELFKFKTIQQNIVCSNQFDQDIYRKVCNLADIQFINPDNSLDNKNSTVVNLSEGEKKKVHYARFLYQIIMNRGTIRYVCLDEPTAAFDRKLAVAFFKQLDKLVKELGLVAFVVDHSLLGIKNESKVIFICKQQVNFGTHGQLLKDVPEYIELFSVA